MTVLPDPPLGDRRAETRWLGCSPHVGTQEAKSAHVGYEARDEPLGHRIPADLVEDRRRRKRSALGDWLPR